VPYTGSESEVESEIDKDPKVNPRSSEAQQQPGGADLRRLFYNSSPQPPSCPIIIVLNSIIELSVSRFLDLCFVSRVRNIIFRT
jgi:hypothetical protein